jgi:hypothetical protein
MRLETALKNWRAAEKTLSAIDERIAKLSHGKELSAEGASADSKLGRAREAARRRADECWVRYLQELEPESGGDAQD